MLNRFLHWLALTKTERNILTFLTAAFFIGSGIRYGRKAFDDTPHFDYRASDSIFAARGAEGPASSPSDSTSHRSGPVDINRATKESLDALPGIGAVTATRIIEYRTAHGRFRSVDELSKIKGLSKSKLNKLRPLITTGGKDD